MLFRTMRNSGTSWALINQLHMTKGTKINTHTLHGNSPYVTETGFYLKMWFLIAFTFKLVQIFFVWNNKSFHDTYTHYLHTVDIIYNWNLFFLFWAMCKCISVNESQSPCARVSESIRISRGDHSTHQSLSTGNREQVMRGGEEGVNKGWCV